MLRLKKVNILILLTFMMFVSAACGAKKAEQTTGDVQVNNEPVKTMLESPEFSYEKEEMLPGIMVDIIGYAPNEPKSAVLEGTILPAEFDVVDNFTGNVVYSGKVDKQTENSVEGRNYGIADFSSVTEEGSYHIEAEFLGRSKDFEIKNGIYELLVEKSFEGLNGLKKNENISEQVLLENSDGKFVEVSGGLVTNSEGERDVAEGCLAVYDLLKTYEYYQNAFKDTELIDIVKYEIRWLMKMQNPETGGVYTSVSLKTDSDSFIVVGESTRATAYFTAVMAKSSYAFAKTDPALSKECYKRAVNAWNCLEANKELVGASQMFRASTELYRASGAVEYRNVAETYLSQNLNRKFEERIEIDAAMTYMSTSRSVSLSYCTILMQNFMSRAENIAAKSKNARFMIAPDCEGDGALLRNLAELVEADFILTSREYGDIELNYLHYLCGRNSESRIHDELAKSPDAYAQFLLLMGRLLTDNTIR